jgi:hypothetical protein
VIEQFVFLFLASVLFGASLGKLLCVVIRLHTERRAPVQPELPVLRPKNPVSDSP